jgi:hypothetical protein
MSSHRDFIDIAAAFHKALNECDSVAERNGAARAARSIGEMYRARTSAFDLKMFLDNCGMKATL